MTVAETTTSSSSPSTKSKSSPPPSPPSSSSSPTSRLDQILDVVDVIIDRFEEFVVAIYSTLTGCVTSRMNIQGCRFVGGYMRIAFAIICIVDRLLLGVDYNYFFNPHDGMLQITNTMEDNDSSSTWSYYHPEKLFNLLSYTTTMSQRWMLYFVGLLNLVLLLIGVAPRLNLILWHINFVSIMQYSTYNILSDGDDTGNVPLMRILNIYFLFLPLHHVTIWDGFGLRCRRKEQRTQQTITTSTVDQPKSQSSLSLLRGKNHHPEHQEPILKSQKDDNADDDDIKDDKNDDRDNKGDKTENTIRSDGKAGIDDTIDQTSSSSASSSCDDEYDHDSSSYSPSWPMWPIYLLQWEAVTIMIGAAVGKWWESTNFNNSSHWIDGTSMYYIAFGCPDECRGLVDYPNVIFDRTIVIKFMTWFALIVETVGPILIWWTPTRMISYVALTMLHFGIDLTMNMHTFQPLMVLLWSSFLIRPIPSSSNPNDTKNGDDDHHHDRSTTTGIETSTKPTRSTTTTRTTHRVTPQWRRPLDFTIYITLLTVSLSMSLPLNEVFPFMRKYRVPGLMHYAKFVLWRNDIVDDYIKPISRSIGFHQGVWALFDGAFEGESTFMTVHAAYANGTIVKDYWTTPDWENLPPLQRKVLYNQLNVYKHISDCEGCEEQKRILLGLVHEIMDSESDEDDFVHMELYSYGVRPPVLHRKWDTNLSWWSPIRQPLEYLDEEFQMGIIICHDVMDGGCDDKELYKTFSGAGSLVPSQRWDKVL